MSDITISLSNIQNIKTVNITGLGVFKVRRLGAGEEYDLSTKRREIAKAVREMMKINSDMNLITDEAEQEKFATKNLPKIDKLQQKVSRLQNEELEAYKRCFTDDNGGKNTDKLIDILSPEERVKLYEAIFNPKEEDDEAKDEK